MRARIGKLGFRTDQDGGVLQRDTSSGAACCQTRAVDEDDEILGNRAPPLRLPDDIRRAVVHEKTITAEEEQTFGLVVKVMKAAHISVRRYITRLAGRGDDARDDDY